MSRRHAPVLLLLAAALLWPSRPVQANMANPVHAGDPIGEPSGDLRSVYIERETLTIDLRPLEASPTHGDGKPAVVEAVYRVNNRGASLTTDLLFVANALTTPERSGVWLDDRPVRVRQEKAGAAPGLPPSWRAPATTPAIGEGDAMRYETDAPSTLAFSLTLSPGSHTIRVRYAARPTAYSGDSPTVYWQLGYVLAPARQWAGFGGLTATIHVPPGWRAASDPGMTRQGDVLTGSWTRVPADALAVTVQAPPPSVPNFGALAGIGGLAVCVLLGGLAGRGLGRRGWSSAWATPLSLAMGFVWSFATFLTTWTAGPAALKARAGEQAAWTYGYGEGMMAALLTPVLLVVGIAATQTAAFVAKRRAVRRL